MSHTAMVPFYRKGRYFNHQFANRRHNSSNPDDSIYPHMLRR